MKPGETTKASMLDQRYFFVVSLIQLGPIFGFSVGQPLSGQPSAAVPGTATTKGMYILLMNT